VPIAATAFLASLHVRRTIETQANENLRAMSRNVGQQILDRLLIAEDSLDSIAVGNASSNPIAITAAERRTGAGIRAIFGSMPPADIGPVDGLKAALIVDFSGDDPEVFLAKAFGDDIVVGQLSAEYLWGTSNLLRYGLDLCVYATTSRKPLFCTNDIPAEGTDAILKSIGVGSSGEFRWSHDGSEQIAAQWELFLPSQFEAETWAIVVVEPAALALEPLAAFNRVFQQAVIFSIIVIALLALYQIRRILEPMYKLVAGTKRFAEADFAARISLESRDEFNDLGSAMNDMASRLGRQFDTLNALSEIDRLILATQSIEQVVELILQRVAAVVPNRNIHVLLLDPEPSHARFYSAYAGPTDRPPSGRLEISDELREWLEKDVAGHIVDEDDSASPIRQIQNVAIAGSAAALPLFRGDELRGALIAERTAASTGVDAGLTSLREFADRFSVAIAAADREKELFNRAHFDSLTGLPNRQLCYDRLGQAISHARREDHQLAVLFIDLDSFKQVNDSFGHSHGDELLRSTAQRLSQALRDTDTVARLGGDEYVVILPHIHGALEVEAVANKILAALSGPFIIEGQESFVSASIGATIYPGDGATAEELLRKADTAMYGAKDAGRARCVFFAQEMDLRVRETLAMQTDLRNALANGEFFLAFQPQIDLKTGLPVCAEALLRWKHPERGLVSPGVFIPILEDIGHIESVGKWVLRAAVEQFVAWRCNGLDLARIAVNLSSRQLFDRDFADFVLRTLKANQVNGGELELELTEHSLIKDQAQTNETLRVLAENGIRLAIDDFGTGYSSLGYLRTLNFAVLKIDQSFIKGLPDEKSLAIVEAILAVAHSLGKEVVAEGVEMAIHETLLAERGCEVAQGFLYTPPLESAAFLDWALRVQKASSESAVLAAIRR
jgi:diguanylate cyclase (GGDEF)-like protein